MIDNFALGLVHLLLAIAVWRLLTRSDLDQDADEPDAPLAEPRRPRRARR